jgi:hypothetical protein
LDIPVFHEAGGVVALGGSIGHFHHCHPVFGLEIRQMKKKNSRLFKQRLFRGHISVGIAVSLMMYLSVFFGTFAIFMPQIQAWEKPSRHFETADIAGIDYEPMLAAVLSDPDFPRDNIILKLPGYTGDPALRITHQFTAETVFNPMTGERLADEGKSTGLGMFLNGLHYGRPLKKVGYYIFGFMSVGGLFLVAGGLLLIAVLKYKGPARSRQAVFSRWHRKLFTWCFPVFTVFVICASVMCLSFDGPFLMTNIVTGGETSNIGSIIGPVLFPEDPPVGKADEAAAMMPISQLIEKARGINPQITFQQLTLMNWGDETARIKLAGYNPYKPFLNGVTNKPDIVLNAHDGSLVKQTRVQDRPWSVLLMDFFYGVHLLFHVGGGLRLIFAVIMAACGVAVGFGVLLALEKKAKKFGDDVPFYHWLGKLSLTVMVGVIPATGVLFVLQWLLPFELSDRLVWQQGLFYNAWLATLAWSFFRLNSYAAAREFMALGGVLYVCAPVLHFIKTGFGPFDLVRGNMPGIVSVDLGLLLFGGLLLMLAYRLPKSRTEARLLWNEKQKKVKHA